MAGEAIQGGRSAVIQTMPESGCPVNELPSIVGPGHVVVGCAMGSAGTKYIWHNAGTGALCAIELCDD